MHPNSPHILAKSVPKFLDFGSTKNSKKVGLQKVSKKIWFTLEPPPPSPPYVGLGLGLGGTMDREEPV